MEINEGSSTSFGVKEIYVYREFNNQYGKYEENMNVTTAFDNIEDLLEFINKRKEFYTKFWNKRKIEIEIIDRGKE